MRQDPRETIGTNEARELAWTQGAAFVAVLQATYVSALQARWRQRAGRLKQGRQTAKAEGVCAAARET